MNKDSMMEIDEERRQVDRAKKEQADRYLLWMALIEKGFPKADAEKHLKYHKKKWAELKNIDVTLKERKEKALVDWWRNEPDVARDWWISEYRSVFIDKSDENLNKEFQEAIEYYLL